MAFILFFHTHIRKYLNPSSFYLQHRSRQDFLFLSSSLYLLISLYYCVSFCCKLVTYRWISSNSISPLKNTFPICGIPKRETNERTKERTSGGGITKYIRNRTGSGSGDLRLLYNTHCQKKKKNNNNNYNNNNSWTIIKAAHRK